MKKTVIILLFILAACIYGLRERSDYSVDKATEFITEHAETESRNWCAWYVMRAMYAGGQPVPLLRACDYKWYFRHVLKHRFHEVPIEGYTPQKGDIVVFPSIDNHFYGHIAMWNGHQWVSDFKQNNLIISNDYDPEKRTIFRPSGPAVSK